MREKGFAPILVLVIVAVGVLVIGTVAYFQLKTKSTPQSQQTQTVTQPTPSPFQATLPAQKDERSQKVEVEQVHLRNLQYYLAGDADNFALAFSSGYIDWGSGPRNMDKAHFSEVFSSERFNDLKDKKPEELVDLDNKIVLGYSEIINHEVFKSFEGKHGFHFQDGDVYIYYPTKQQTLMPDGFFGVYRKEDNSWKIVIAD